MAVYINSISDLVLFYTKISKVLFLGSGNNLLEIETNTFTFDLEEIIAQSVNPL